jgi:hypothetical protein
MSSVASVAQSLRASPQAQIAPSAPSTSVDLSALTRLASDEQRFSTRRLALGETRRELSVSLSRQWRGGRWAPQRQMLEVSML